MEKIFIILFLIITTLFGEENYIEKKLNDYINNYNSNLPFERTIFLKENKATLSKMTINYNFELKNLENKSKLFKEIYALSYIVRKYNMICLNQREQYILNISNGINIKFKEKSKLIKELELNKNSCNDFVSSQINDLYNNINKNLLTKQSKKEYLREIYKYYDKSIFDLSSSLSINNNIELKFNIKSNKRPSTIKRLLTRKMCSSNINYITVAISKKINIEVKNNKFISKDTFIIDKNTCDKYREKNKNYKSILNSF